MFNDQLDTSTASYKMFHRYLTVAFKIQPDYTLSSPDNVMIMDVFKHSVNGYSISRRFQATVNDSAVVLEEAPENQQKEAPADLDTILGGTFRMGFLDQKEASRKDAVVLPHFEIIKQAEAAQQKESMDELRLVDDEGGMDEEDDMDV